MSVFAFYSFLLTRITLNHIISSPSLWIPMGPDFLPLRAHKVPCFYQGRFYLKVHVRNLLILDSRAISSVQRSEILLVPLFWSTFGSPFHSAPSFLPSTWVSQGRAFPHNFFVEVGRHYDNNYTRFIDTRHSSSKTYTNWVQQQ